MEEQKKTDLRNLLIHDLSEHLPKAVEPILPPDMNLEDIEKMIDEGVEMVMDSTTMLRFLEQDMDKREHVSTVVTQVIKLLLSMKVVSEGGELEPHPEDYVELREMLTKYYEKDKRTAEG